MRAAGEDGQSDGEEEGEDGQQPDRPPRDRRERVSARASSEAPARPSSRPGPASHAGRASDAEVWHRERRSRSPAGAGGSASASNQSGRAFGRNRRGWSIIDRWRRPVGARRVHSAARRALEARFKPGLEGADRRYRGRSPPRRPATRGSGGRRARRAARGSGDESLAPTGRARRSVLGIAVSPHRQARATWISTTSRRLARRASR